MNHDVLIIGAGMAGLSAALELKHRGISYQLLDAGNEPGGRALTRRLPSGVPVDLGAHWLHGEDNPLKALLESYRIPYHKDKARQLYIHQHGSMKKSHGDKWLERAVDSKLARRIKSGEEPDRPVTQLAVDEPSRDVLRDFARLWNGIDPPLVPSAKEFLTDENKPGGLQLEDGVGALIGKMADDAGHEHILLNTKVASVATHGSHVIVRAQDGEEWKANHAIFTGSLAVLQSGLVTFGPALSESFQKQLAGIVMGKVNKIIIEFEPDFLKKRDIPEDMAVELLDHEPPHFCHLHGAGLPLATIFVTGSQAEKVEQLDDDAALNYAIRILAPIEKLNGFSAHMVGKPIVTRWAGNPYIAGAYSACMPGAGRTGPCMEGRIIFCGDTFDQHFPASLAGAHRSGKAAALAIAHKI